MVHFMDKLIIYRVGSTPDDMLEAARQGPHL
jgi:hypothetical protein